MKIIVLLIIKDSLQGLDGKLKQVRWEMSVWKRFACAILLVEKQEWITYAKILDGGKSISLYNAYINKITCN